MKDKHEKWLLAITDKGHEQLVFNNISLKPSITKIEGNVKILIFHDSKEEIDKLYQKLRPFEREDRSISLFVGTMWEQNMPGGLNEILKSVSESF